MCDILLKLCNQFLYNLYAIIFINIYNSNY